MTISKKCSVIQFAIGVYAFFQFNLPFNKLAHQWCSTSSTFLHRRSILRTLMIYGTLTISLGKQLLREERCSLSEIYCKCHWMLACWMCTPSWCRVGVQIIQHTVCLFILGILQLSAIISRQLHAKLSSNNSSMDIKYNSKHSSQIQ